MNPRRICGACVGDALIIFIFRNTSREEAKRGCGGRADLPRTAQACGSSIIVTILTKLSPNEVMFGLHHISEGQWIHDRGCIISLKVNRFTVVAASNL